MVGIIASHWRRCHDLEAITPELETKVSKAIKGQPG